MRKVTCICDTIIKGVTFVKGCDYRVDYNPHYVNLCVALLFLTVLPALEAVHFGVANLWVVLLFLMV